MEADRVNAALESIKKAALRLEEVIGELKTFEDKAEGLKQTISLLMEQCNLDELTVPTGEEEIVIKRNRRSCRLFNKEKLAEEALIPKSEINFVTVSELVESRVISSEKLREMYKDSEYSFISLRRRASTASKE